MKTERLPKDEKKLDMTTNIGGNWMGKMRKKSVGPGLGMCPTVTQDGKCTVGNDLQSPGRLEPRHASLLTYKYASAFHVEP